jgi:putative tricarboxylic transport membrane protein
LSKRFHAVAPYVVVFAIAAALFHVASHFAFTPRGDRPGPDVWPRAILVLMMVVCVLRIGFGLRADADARSSAEEAGDAGVLADVASSVQAERDVPEEVPGRRHPWRLVVGIVLTAAYVATLGVLGFAIGTFTYMLLMAIVGRYRRHGVAAATALVGTLVLMFVFMKIVYLSLPIGMGPCEAVSLALMKLMGVH